MVDAPNVARSLALYLTRFGMGAVGDRAGMRIGHDLVLAWAGLFALTLYRNAPFVLARFACFVFHEGLRFRCIRFKECFPNKNVPRSHCLYRLARR